MSDKLKISLILDYDQKTSSQALLFQQTMADFFKEQGAQTMFDCYGWEKPPCELLWGQTYLEFSLASLEFSLALNDYAPSSYAAWAILTRDPRVRSWQYITLGVRPRYTGMGLRREVLIRASDWAFAHNEAETVTAEIYASNSEQLKKYHRDALLGFPFIWSGYISLGETQLVMFSREKPEKKRATSKQNRGSRLPALRRA